MEKRFAKVVAGVVRNISVATRPEDATDCIPLVEGVDDEIGIDDLYDGNVFSKKPKPPKTPEELAKEAQQVVDTAAKDSVKLDAVIQYLVSHTPDECYAKVQADVTDLASAKVMMGKFATALSVLARGSLR